MDEIDRRWEERLAREKDAARDAEERGDLPAVVRALTNVADGHDLLGRHADAMAVLSRAVEIARRTADDRLIAGALMARGANASVFVDDEEAALADLEAACEIYTRLGDDHGHALALRELGKFFRHYDDGMDDARRALDESVRMLRQHGPPAELIESLTWLAFLERRAERWKEMDQALAEVVSVHARSDLPPAVLDRILGLQAEAAAEQGHYGRALQLLVTSGVRMAKLIAKHPWLSLRSTLTFFRRRAESRREPFVSDEELFEDDDPELRKLLPESVQEYIDHAKKDGKHS